MKPFDRVLAVSQLFLLGAYELLGWLAFDWNGWIVFAVWLIGFWTFNVLVASGVRLFFRLMEPQVEPNVVDITEDDIGG